MNSREVPSGAEEIKKEDLMAEALKLNEGQEIKSIKKKAKDIEDKAYLVIEAEKLTKEHHQLDDKVS